MGAIIYLSIIVSIMVGITIYFLPSIIGMGKKQGCAIVAVNVFLGWTLIGWALALIWACLEDPEINVIIDNKDKYKSTPSKYDELEHLAILRDKGIISDEEFNIKKQDILGVKIEVNRATIETSTPKLKDEIDQDQENKNSDLIKKWKKLRGD